VLRAKIFFFVTFSGLGTIYQKHWRVGLNKYFCLAKEQSLFLIYLLLP